MLRSKVFNLVVLLISNRTFCVYFIMSQNMRYQVFNQNFSRIVKQRMVTVSLEVINSPSHPSLAPQVLPPNQQFDMPTYMVRNLTQYM